MNQPKKNLEDLGRIIESGSPLQHAAVGQMAQTLRREQRTGKSPPSLSAKWEGEGHLVIQTSGGKFVDVNIWGTVCQITFFSESLLNEQQVLELFGGCVTGYRPLRDDELNYPIVHEDGYNIFVSSEPIISDEGQDWGRTEIHINRNGQIKNITVMTNGNLIDYYLSDCLWEISLMQEHSHIEGAKNRDDNLNIVRGGASAFKWVSNREESLRLQPQFWAMVRRLIGEDKIISVTRTADYTLPQAKKMYPELQRSTQKRRYKTSETGKLEPWKWVSDDDKLPHYFFLLREGAGFVEVGCVVDRTQSTYMVPYIFFATVWFENGAYFEDVRAVL